MYGLPVAYFLRQIEDFRAGRRHSSDPRKPNLPTMIDLAMAPPTRMHGNLFVKTSDDLTEPLTDRIVEVPTDFERQRQSDDPRLG